MKESYNGHNQISPFGRNDKEGKEIGAGRLIRRRLGLIKRVIRNVNDPNSPLGTGGMHHWHPTSGASAAAGGQKEKRHA
jgi:hypothetical protein